MIKSIVLTYGVKVGEEFFYKDRFFKNFSEVEEFVNSNPNLTYFKMKINRVKDE